MRHAPCDATRSQRVPRRPWRREAAAAALVGLATLALALVFLRDPLGQDDRRIFAHAHQFLAGARGTAAFAATHYRVGFVL